MQRPELFGYGDAAHFLEMSHQRFNYLVKRDNIYFKTTSSGRIFFKEDIVEYKRQRFDKMKHKGVK